ncbi:hypothetical protein G7074_12330 [Pedobacter sp. HDW13]|uniref:hypothetical protein n=1 Tax=unclassified Pedobacter TaxID=2628915 RepID=UPI000F5916F4|nr:MULTISPECIES: hypothetical protein [unclassified Pedobacter]QIL39982.1 hypothetical protein G7074_12330 [Pedobacter sp. HDW13]RQO64257.1 hypothetical protein DBR40_26095 [Pedobacter sp. KBW01]
MINKYFAIFLLGFISIILYACGKKTDKERAIALVEKQYENSSQKLNFEQATLDSLYHISPKAYADSIAKGHELDSTLAVLETEIEHFSQAESDSVGLISAKLTKERYSLLELAKTKPKFIGWKLSGVTKAGDIAASLSFNFDQGISKIVP